MKSISELLRNETFIYKGGLYKKSDFTSARRLGIILADWTIEWFHANPVIRFPPDTQVQTVRIKIIGA